MTELERRISDLNFERGTRGGGVYTAFFYNASPYGDEQAQTMESGPSFSEGELLSMYEDLLSVLPLPGNRRVWWQTLKR